MFCVNVVTKLLTKLSSLSHCPLLHRSTGTALAPNFGLALEPKPLMKILVNEPKTSEVKLATEKQFIVSGAFDNINIILNHHHETSQDTDIT